MDLEACICVCVCVCVCVYLSCLGFSVFPGLVIFYYFIIFMKPQAII